MASTELARADWAPDLEAQIVALRDQIAPEASGPELALYAQVCRHLGLSPFAGQIVLIGRHNRTLGRKVHTHQVTVAGRRAIADRTGELVGIEGPEWCGPRDERGVLNWLEVWDRDEYPYCARVFVHRRGWVKPSNGTVKWSEFAQYGREGRPLQQWEQMPSHMLGKCAESLALRRAFPDVINDEVAGAYVTADVDYLDDETGTGEAAAVPTPAPEVDGRPPVSGPAVSDLELDDLEAQIATLDGWTRNELRSWWMTPPPLPNVRALDRDQYEAVLEWITRPPRRNEEL